MGVPEGKEREKGMESLFKEIMAKNLPDRRTVDQVAMGRRRIE